MKQFFANFTVARRTFLIYFICHFFEECKATAFQRIFPHYFYVFIFFARIRKKNKTLPKIITSKKQKKQKQKLSSIFLSLMRRVSRFSKRYCDERR